MEHRYILSIENKVGKVSFKCLAKIPPLFAEFDLEKERSVLDEQGLRIAENQENSQKNRRKLAESTRGDCSVLLPSKKLG